MVTTTEAGTAAGTETPLPELPLLLVDDDAPFRQRLSVMLTRRGFAVTAVGSLSEARVEAARLRPGHAVVDMRLEDGNGLDLVAELRSLSPDVRIVMLTGYGNLATAVAAVARLP
jgi:two-component system, response regulator RegA